MNYESECTLFHIDLFNYGFTKKLINPEVRVTYKYEFYPKRKYYYPFQKDIVGYIHQYFYSHKQARNKFMSNYNIKNLKLNTIVNQWYTNERIID